MKRQWLLLIGAPFLVLVASGLPAQGKTIQTPPIRLVAASPAIALNPSAGKPGETVAVSGSGFACHGGKAIAVVFFDSTQQGSGVPIACTGTFSTSFRLPDVPIGTYTVSAEGYAPRAAPPPAATPTDTPVVPTATNTATPTATVKPTNTSTATPANTATPTNTAAPTNTPAPTSTATPTLTPTATPTGTPTATATVNTSQPPPGALPPQPRLTLSKAADAPSVSAGSPIGFTITVGNGAGPGTGTATGVTVSDPLPGGAGVSWSISPAYAGPGTCAITGAAPSQTLTCSVGTLAPGATASVHVTSGTNDTSCGTYPNTASLSASNAPTVTASASTTVQCASLAVTKTADAPTVDAGSPIGFTVRVSNGSAVGTGTATGATLSDPLPGGTGVSWTISPPYSGPGTCTITGAPPSQTLTCSFGNLAPGAGTSVHISSGTTGSSCGSYPNSATLSATNAPSTTGSASTTVQCPSLAVTKTGATTTGVGVASAAPTVIQFTIASSNGSAPGTGTATGVTLNDPLPARAAGAPATVPPEMWAINPLYNAPPYNCMISGAAGAQTLTCAFGNFAPGVSRTVQVAAVANSCGTYSNTAFLSATNAPTVRSMPPATAGFSCPPPPQLKSRSVEAVIGAPGSPMWFDLAAGSGSRAGMRGERGEPAQRGPVAMRAQVRSGSSLSAAVPSGYSFDGDRASVTVTVKAPSAPFTVKQRGSCTPPPTAGFPTTCTITETVTNNSGHRQRFDQVANQIPGNITVVGQSSRRGAIKASGQQVNWGGFTLGPQTRATATIRVTFTPTRTQVGQHVRLSIGIRASAVDLTTGRRYFTRYGTLFTHVRVMALPQTGSGGVAPNTSVNALPQTGGGAGTHT